MAIQPDVSGLEMRLEIIPKENVFEDIALVHEIGSEMPAFLEETQAFVVEPVYEKKLGGEVIVFLIGVSAQWLAIASPTLLNAAESKLVEMVVEKMVEKIKPILSRKKPESRNQVSVCWQNDQQQVTVTIDEGRGPHSEVNVSWKRNKQKVTIIIKASA